MPIDRSKWGSRGSLVLAVPCHQAPGRTEPCFLRGPGGGFLTGLLDQVPHLAGHVAEAGEGAQWHRVGEEQRRAFLDVGLPHVGLTARRLRPLEAHVPRAIHHRRACWRTDRSDTVRSFPSSHRTDPRCQPMEFPSPSATIVCRAIGTEPETRYGPFSVTLICIVFSGCIGASRERTPSVISWNADPSFLSLSRAVANGQAATLEPSLPGRSVRSR